MKNDDSYATVEIFNDLRRFDDETALIEKAFPADTLQGVLAAIYLDRTFLTIYTEKCFHSAPRLPAPQVARLRAWIATNPPALAFPRGALADTLAEADKPAWRTVNDLVRFMLTASIERANGDRWLFGDEAAFTDLICWLLYSDCGLIKLEN